MARDSENEIPVVGVFAPDDEGADWLTYAVAEMGPRVGVRLRLVERPSEMSQVGGPILLYMTDPSALPDSDQERPRIAIHRAARRGEGGTSPRLHGLVRSEEGRAYFFAPPDSEVNLLAEHLNGWSINADLFRMVWFLLSRREEQEIACVDAHGRVPSSLTFQVEAGLVDRPLVEDAAALLRRILERSGVQPRPAAPWGDRSFAVCLTHDLDSLRKFSGIRGIAGAFRRELRHRPIRLASQFAARCFTRRDPHLRGMETIVREAHDGKHPTVFLVGKNRHRLDPDYALDDPALAGLSALLEEKGGELGLHPGYDCGASEQNMEEEAAAFEKSFGRRPRAARLHYLRWDARITASTLQSAGIETDATLGWPDTPGFRSGTALPFRIVHPRRDEPLELLEVPLALMDTTLALHRRESLEEAVETARSIIRTVRNCGGVLQLLQHPHLAADAPAGDWDSWWRQVTEEVDRLSPLYLTVSEARQRWLAAAALYAATPSGCS